MMNIEEYKKELDELFLSFFPQKTNSKEIYECKNKFTIEDIKETRNGIYEDSKKLKGYKKAEQELWNKYFSDKK